MLSLVKKTKMLPLNGFQDSDSLEMHGMLLIYYEPSTPAELHFKCKERLVFWTSIDSRCGKKNSQRMIEMGPYRVEVRSFPKSYSRC